MSLSLKQQEFSRCVGLLLTYATKQNYGIVLGDAFRDPRVHGRYGRRGPYGSAKSNHKICLAIDLNLFVDGEYISSSQHKAWGDLHQYWESLSPHSAGMIVGDACHFSFEHNGRW